MPRRRAAFSLAALILIAATLLLAFGIADNVELPIRDVVMRTLPARPATSTVIVAIDEKSVSVNGPWPWKREVLANIVNRCVDSGARAIVLDTLLSEPRQGDAQLAAALKRVPAVAVAVIDGRGNWVVAASPIREAARPAHGNFELDHDGILRRLASTKQSGDRAFIAFSFDVASLVTGAPVPVGRTIAPAFRTRARGIPIISAVDVPNAFLRNKIVFIGPTALALGDRVLTPTSTHGLPDPGVTVHAAATEALIRGERIRDLPPIVAGFFAALLAVIAMLRPRITIITATSVAVIGVALIALSGVAIPFVIFEMSIVVGAVAEKIRQSRVAVSRIESGLGVTPAGDDVVPRLEEIAMHIVERRARDAESRRVLAHELKTPLASMRGLTQLLAGFEF